MVDPREACTTCNTIGPHTEEECKARRPLCHRGDGRRTCIQALANECLPTCLDCYFEKRIAVPAWVFS